ncbi:hypothetical protein KC19_10G164900 [Ceratodon purpureus]|uniref:O-methyltransferase n=1 Tax=Ceratodon purpureus TaxID=3225 RepID=A0A8T0GL11_CERPU|nr:hypothetical protein KC19_10G164900 [Ceratodon purpureus]
MSTTMEVQEKAVEAFYVMQELNYIYSVPLALKAALELGIPDILAGAGPGASLTPQQIADKLPRKSHDAAQKVGRILRLLAHRGVFAQVEAAESETGYGLTDVSKYFVTGSEFELTPYAVMMQRREMQAPMNHLREAVEDDADGFVLANGSDMWTYGSAHPDFNDVFNASMKSRSKLLNTIIARYYEGFPHVRCLVDVGGGVGGALAHIVSVHPHIRGRNFDLPHVISTAPQIPGVEHVAGSFLEFIPSGDAILLQQVLHDWGDAECITILRNCHKALAESGRVLIREHVIDPSRNSAAKTGAALNSDVLMLALYQGRGRERTSAEWRHLLGAAGFSHVSFLSLQGLDLIESVKTSALVD